MIADVDRAVWGVFWANMWLASRIADSWSWGTDPRHATRWRFEDARILMRGLPAGYEGAQVRKVGFDS